MRHEASRTLDRGDEARNLISCWNATQSRVDSLFSHYHRDILLTFFCGGGWFAAHKISFFARAKYPKSSHHFRYGFAALCGESWLLAPFIAALPQNWLNDYSIVSAGIAGRKCEVFWKWKDTLVAKLANFALGKFRSLFCLLKLIYGIHKIISMAMIDEFVWRFCLFTFSCRANPCDFFLEKCSNNII